MLIYGNEEEAARFWAYRKTNRLIHQAVPEETRVLKSLAELEEIRDPGTELLVLNVKDIEVLRWLYRKKWQHLWFPVCGRMLGVLQPDADDLLEKTLSGSTNWLWHKEANWFRMLRSYFLRKPVMDSLPGHIQLEHTSYCNARCIMCGHAIYENRGAMHISDQMVERIQSLLPTCEVMVLHGYGEPFMTRGLDHLMDLYAKYQVDVTSNTNLTFLPENLLERLPGVMRHLRISCDGVTKEVYEGIRPGLKFETFLNNLERLRKAAPQMELMMETVIMRQNVHQIPEMIRFAKHHGFSQISLNRLGAHPVLNNEKDCLQYYPQMTSRYLREGLEEAARLGIRVYYPVEWLLESESPEKAAAEQKAAAAYPFRMEPLFVAEDQKLIIHNATLLSREDLSLLAGIYGCSGMCDSLIGRTNLDLEGNIYACCMNTLKKLGNLYELSDREFYNTETLIKMREQFYQGDIPSYCDNCSYVMNHTLALADVYRVS